MSELIFRPAKLDDIETYYALYRAEMIEIYGGCTMSQDEVLGDWQVPGFDVATATMAAFTGDDRMVAYAQVLDYSNPPVRPLLFVYVESAYRGQGIGTRLTEWGIERAKAVFSRVPEEARVVLQCYGLVAGANALLENQGFEKIRESHQMQITFNGTVPEARFPEGFRLESMADGLPLRELVHMSREAFRDHRGHIERPLEEDVARWQHEVEAFAGNFDPALFVLLKDRDESAGVIMAWPVSEEDEQMAWVSVLGVLPAYRRRGFATQLLNYIFGEFQKRGIPKAGLSVDGSSLTGANKLYERVGMHIAHRFNAYELELRSGVELTVQG